MNHGTVPLRKTDKSETIWDSDYIADIDKKTQSVAGGKKSAKKRTNKRKSRKARK
jgi:hypothetical protein